jgi:hypothetical protein
VGLRGNIEITIYIFRIVSVGGTKPANSDCCFVGPDSVECPSETIISFFRSRWNIVYVGEFFDGDDSFSDKVVKIAYNVFNKYTFTTVSIVGHIEVRPISEIKPKLIPVFIKAFNYTTSENRPGLPFVVLWAKAECFISRDRHDLPHEF